MGSFLLAAIRSWPLQAAVVVAIGVFVLLRVPRGVRRDVMVWLFLGVFFEGIGVAINVWKSVGQGDPLSFPLSTAAALDLPSIAIAGGGLAHHWIRRRMDTDSDLLVAVLGLVAIAAGLVVLGNTPSAKWDFAVLSHVALFSLAVFVGAYSVYLCAFPKGAEPAAGNQSGGGSVGK